MAEIRAMSEIRAITVPIVPIPVLPGCKLYSTGTVLRVKLKKLIAQAISKGKKMEY
jgi:hypothetical protein